MSNPCSVWRAPSTIGSSPAQFSSTQGFAHAWISSRVVVPAINARHLRSTSVRVGGVSCVIVSPAARLESLFLADEELDRTAVGVLDDDVHLAACGLDEALERREQHVAAALEPGHLGLVHVE